MFIFRKIWYVLTLPLLIITLLTTPEASSTESAEFIGEDVFVFDKALLMGQGITTDGDYFYTSGSITALNLTALCKISADDMEIQQTAVNPLPEECTERGNDHIGGISYYDGKIYAPVEGGDICYACIVVFDAETLEPTGEIYDLPNENYDDGVPWCAVDTQTGLLYASKWSNAKTIYVYDINNEMKLVREIELTGLGEIHRIQGGEFCNGTLYLSEDIENNDKYKNILSVNVETGEVAFAAVRDVGECDSIEAEGMTFTRSENGTVMHVLDYNKLVGIFVRHYNVNF